MKTKVLVLVILFLFLSACSAHKVYEDTAEGEFKGVVQVRWIEPDLFLFVPQKDDPLRFITSNKTFVFEPKTMYTDGGSIPRIFWSIPGYSPWGIAPAYIIHDWIFMAHYCDIEDYKNISFDDSSRIMGECIKTLMENEKVPKDETIFFNVVTAVKSRIAKKIWDSGKCNLPSEQLAYGTIGDLRPLLSSESEELRYQLGKIEDEMRATSDVKLREKYEKETLALKNKLIQFNKIYDAAAELPVNAPATKLVFTIDMNASDDN